MIMCKQLWQGNYYQDFDKLCRIYAKFLFKYEKNKKVKQTTFKSHLFQPHSDPPPPDRHHQAQNSWDDNMHHKFCNRLHSVFSHQGTAHIEHILNGHYPKILGGIFLK